MSDAPRSFAHSDARTIGMIYSARVPDVLEAPIQRAVKIVGLRIRFKDRRAFLAFRRGGHLMTDSGQLTEPVVVEGDCLAPFLSAGDVVWHLPREPWDGDVVLVRMRYRRFTMMLGAGSQNIRERLAVKQLRIAPDGSRYLCAADGSVDADAHEILGVVVAWQRRGWRRPALRRMDFEVTAEA